MGAMVFFGGAAVLTFVIGVLFIITCGHDREGRKYGFQLLGLSLFCVLLAVIAVL
jgi:hypothetical protein